MRLSVFATAQVAIPRRQHLGDQFHDNDNTLRLGQSECALIARPQLQVEVRCVTAGVYEFLSALSEGRTVGEAIGRGTANAPDFDLIECFNALISADVVVGLQLSQ